MGEERGARVERIPMASLRPRRVPTRTPAAESEVHRLSASIRSHGLLQPILVRPHGKEYEIVCGQRRYQACKALGLLEMVAVVRVLDDRQAFELSLVENARREPLSLNERREILRRLVGMFPGRPKEELEAWLGPAEASGEPLLNWLETLDEKEAAHAEPVAVVVAGKGRASVEMSWSQDGGQVVPVSGPPGSGDTKVLVNTSSAPAGMRGRGSLVGRIRTLLHGLTKSGKLDI